MHDMKKKQTRGSYARYAGGFFESYADYTGVM
jgi:hypothetical protein